MNVNEYIDECHQAIGKLGAQAVADAERAIADIGRKACQDSERAIDEAGAMALTNLRNWAAELEN